MPSASLPLSKIHNRGVRLELRPVRRKERPHITDVRRTRKKPPRKFIAGRYFSQAFNGKQLDAEIERDIANGCALSETDV